MAWVVMEIDSAELAALNGTEEHRELEGVIFKDEKGKERRFALKAMLPISTSYISHLYPDVDWDQLNCHVSILLGNEIKG